jgi:integrase
LKRLRSRKLSQAYPDYGLGLSRDLVEMNPCHGIERPGAEHQRDRVLTASEIRRLWLALDEGDPITAALYRLQLLTAQRAGELRSMAWRDLDLESGWWIIPTGQSKNKLSHRVPLSPLVMAILRELRTRDDSDTPWVFATPSRRGHRMTAHKSTFRIRKLSAVTVGFRNRSGALAHHRRFLAKGSG